MKKKLLLDMTGEEFKKFIEGTDPGNSKVNTIPEMLEIFRDVRDDETLNQHLQEKFDAISEEVREKVREYVVEMSAEEFITLEDIGTIGADEAVSIIDAAIRNAESPEAGGTTDANNGDGGDAGDNREPQPQQSQEDGGDLSSGGDSDE